MARRGSPPPTRRRPERPWAHLRLTDRIEPGVRVLLVGINPGVRSAQTGHHFAGPSNRFWKLLYESGLTPEPLTYEEDARLPEWGLGVTNLVARPSPGIDDLKPREYLEGWATLEQKIARYRPEIVAFVGVTLYRALWRVLGHAKAPEIRPGFQHASVHGARLFVLPNPSGRNANFSYTEMLEAFRKLRRAMRRLPPSSRKRSGAQTFRLKAEAASYARKTRRRKAGRGTKSPGH
jgi:TDG/mug DNA glycosylase family protein